MSAAYCMACNAPQGPGEPCLCFPIELTHARLVAASDAQKFYKGGERMLEGELEELRRSFGINDVDKMPEGVRTQHGELADD